MLADDRDRAEPEQLRQASRSTATAAQALHRGLRWSESAGSLLASPFQGQTADFFRTSVGSIGASLAAARDAHEQVAQALERVAGPIDDEQLARRRLNKARAELADARKLLADRKTELSAAQCALGTAQTELSAERTRVALVESTNLLRVAAGASPIPVSTAALAAAQRRVQQAERAVREAEQTVERAANRVEEATDHAARARRAHEEAERAREVAVRAFTATCQTANVPLPLPKGPGGPITLGPQFDAAAGADGLSAFARAALDLARAQHTVDLGPGKVDADARVGARAEASGSVGVGPDRVGAEVGAEAFAGAEANVGASVGDEGTVAAEAGAGVRAGVGGGGNAEASFEDGKLKLGASVNAAFGVGGKLSGGITVNPGGVVDKAGDAVEGLVSIVK